MRCVELQNMSDDICLLMSILNENIKMIPGTVLELLMGIDSILDFHDVCCVHSKVFEQILQLDYLECKRMQMVIIYFDDGENNGNQVERELETLIELDEGTEEGEEEKEIKISSNIPKISHKKWQHLHEGDQI